MTPAGQLAAAIDLLADIEADARPADAVANSFFRNRRFIGAGDRREVSTLVWGVLRARRHLGWWLEKFGAEPTPRLLLGAQAIFTGMTVNKIALAFTAGRYGPPPLTELETIVLEKFAGHTLEHPNMPDAVKYEVPDWIMPRLEAQFGPALKAEMDAMAQTAPLDLRVNALKATRDQAILALAAEQLDARPTPYSPWGLRLAGRQSITQGKAFQDGIVEIQDEGSQLVALLVDAKPGMRVVDFCAGAGGKTLAIAMTMENKGHIVACDVSAPRLEGAIKRLRRAGVHNAERHLLEPGDKWVKRQEKKFDRVLIDAPCTGTGTWRRNPDARLRLKENDLAEILPKQAMILDQAQRLLKVGGRLVYATCSLLQEENEMQVTAFLERHPNFGRVALSDPVPEALHGPALRLTPRANGTDGFFGAVLERTA
ncbi:MAG: RsmB/NOP family class I SAM-dependent RNA methyltransferase [Acidocella sp.]|nr:RsmB/NOP family class I SAM-dependent RNA methyltransferase [Acidocella sp.]